MIMLCHIIRNKFGVNFLKVPLSYAASFKRGYLRPVDPFMSSNHLRHWWPRGLLPAIFPINPLGKYRNPSCKWPKNVRFLRKMEDTCSLYLLTISNTVLQGVLLYQVIVSILLFTHYPHLKAPSWKPIFRRLRQAIGRTRCDILECDYYMADKT